MMGISGPQTFCRPPHTFIESAYLIASNGDADNRAGLLFAHRESGGRATAVQRAFQG